MDPVTIAMLVAGGVQVLGPIIGDLMSQGKRDQAEQLLEEAKGYVDATQLPQLEHFKDQVLGPSALTQIDPSTRNAEMDAMDQLQGIQRSGGMTIGDDLAINRANNEAARGEASARARVLDSMRSRGLVSPGVELQSQLAAVQGGADRVADVGAQSAADAQKRVYDSILARANLAGNVRGQDERVAAAQDAIAQYNAAARERGTQMRNLYAQQAYEDQLQKANAQANGNRALAGYYLGDAEKQQGEIAGASRGIGQAVNAVGGYLGGAPTTSPTMPASYPDFSEATPLDYAQPAPTGTTFDPYADPNYPDQRKAQR